MFSLDISDMFKLRLSISSRLLTLVVT